MNAQLLWGVILNTLLGVAACFEMPNFTIWIATPTAVNVLGLALLALGQHRTGARLVLVTSVLFVPLGFLAMLGARKVLDADALEKFKAGEPV